MDHDIHDFISRSQDYLQREYDRIQKHASEDPGTAGDQGEENWAHLFREWLPRYFHVVTKGRILTHSGYLSPQVDVLVLKPSYPKILLETKHYLSAGVAAAFECKTTLKAAHVRAAINTSAKLKRNLPKSYGTPYKELHSGLIFGLLAHSHNWAKPKATTNIEKALWGADAKAVRHPQECIDLLTVSNLATWNVFKMAYVSPCLPDYNDNCKKHYGPNGAAVTGYVCQAIGGDRQESYFSPIGSLLAALFAKLAWAIPDMQGLDQYFRSAKVFGSGQGRTRNWDISIYSEKIRDRVYRGELMNGVAYDEWSVGYI